MARICNSFREDQGCDKIGGDGGEFTGDTTGRKVVIQCD